jgi:hypothetical protein
MRNVVRAMLPALMLIGRMTASEAAVASEERPLGSRALQTVVAVIGNVAPVVATAYAPQCLPGYVLCKALFAGVSVLAAADQLIVSGGADLTQTRAILHRGFGGDWVLTPRHVAGESTPQPLPDPPPPGTGTEGGWEPPPL